MDCKDVRKRISDLIDNEVNENEKQELLDHINNCDDCKKIYEEKKFIKELVQGDMEELPEDFSKNLHYKLVQEKKNKKIKDINSKSKDKKDKNKIISFFDRNKKVLSIAAVLLIALFVISGPLALNFFRMGSREVAVEEAADMAVEQAAGEPAMSKDSITFNESVESEAPREPQADVAYDDGGSDSGADRTGRMIIKSANIEISVVNYDEKEKLILDKVEELNGYISDRYSHIMNNNVNRDKQLKQGYITARIPNKDFNLFLNFIEGLGEVRSTNTSSNDITNQYRDTVAELENLRATEERLKELYDKAEEIDDILEIEREINRIRTNIDRLEGTVKNWERLVDLSTVSINMMEVETLDVAVEKIDKDIFQKAKDGFIESINKIIDVLEAAFVKGVSYSPIIVIGGILLIIGIKLFKRRGV